MVTQKIKMLARLLPTAKIQHDFPNEIGAVDFVRISKWHSHPAVCGVTWAYC